MRALPIPAHRQTDFTLKQYFLLVDTTAKFPTEVKFALQYNNRGELMPV